MLIRTCKWIKSDPSPPHPHPIYLVVLVQPAGEVLLVQHLLEVLLGEQLVLAGPAPGHPVQAEVLQPRQAGQGRGQGGEAVAVEVQLAQVDQVPDALRQPRQLQLLHVQAPYGRQLGDHLWTGSRGEGGGWGWGRSRY